ncbi:related to syntaxin [Cephalotrichum gorgonifer]|uniref:Related to syntaxin n=1 Tax=Cephalotrichum gorgonifer TaxID=2041049 RepID=A0AAE8MWU8_9PEZI|nr:related to syntaxin [Cephalotrichum gorgonifer]
MAPPAEISIPSTIISNSESKPFTLYNITLRLPLRSFVVQKRYSDFAALHAALIEQVGSPPPAPLPPKAWLKSTVSSPELTEDRRRGLESYLRAIAESPDRRWRDTKTWRSFLSLPSSSTTASASSAPGMLRATAVAGAADPTTWLDLHREMRGCLHSAQSYLTRRDGAHDVNNTSGAVEAGSAAKRELIKAGSLLGSLTDGLRSIQENGRVGDGEVRRRRDLLAAARVEKEGLEKLSAKITPSHGPRGGGSGGSAPGGDRVTLLGGPSSSNAGARPGGRVIGGAPPETDQTRELDNAQLLAFQKDVLRAQDDSVAHLTAIVRRQKEIGIAIKDEVDRQTEMLDMLDDDTDRVDAKLRIAKNRTRNL